MYPGRNHCHLEGIPCVNPEDRLREIQDTIEPYILACVEDRGCRSLLISGDYAPKMNDCIRDETRSTEFITDSSILLWVATVNFVLRRAAPAELFRRANHNDLVSILF